MDNVIEDKAKTILSGTEGFNEVLDGVHILPAQGNALAVQTQDSVVLMDSGPGGRVSAGMIEALRSVTNKRVSHICYSHGHLGYNDGAGDWIRHSKERGEPEPVLVAHDNCLVRYRRYRETLGLQKTLAEIQFPGTKVKFTMLDPDLTFHNQIALPVKGRRVELLWVPSETDDCIALWLPDEKLLYAGASFPGTTIPNIGTPLRTQRFSLRWADSCERMAALEPELLVQEFGPVIRGKEVIRTMLMKTAETLRWFRAEVVSRMNQGMNESEILADMIYPEFLNELEYMKARYGAPEYIVRDIYREENGWWDRNPTTLHPASPVEAGDAVLNSLPDPEQIVVAAESLTDTALRFCTQSELTLPHALPEWCL